MKMSHNMLDPFFMSLVYRHILGMHKCHGCIIACCIVTVCGSFSNPPIFFSFFFKRLAATCTMTVRTACPVPHKLRLIYVSTR